MKQFNVPYGNRTLSMTLPEKQILNIVEGAEYPALENIETAVIEAIEHPINSKPLKEIIQPGETVCIVVSDITRAWIRYDAFLPTLVNYLNDLGVSDDKITLLVAYGAHRLQSEAECRLEYGDDIVDRLTIKHSSGVYEGSHYRRVGTTSRGVPIELNEVALDADRVILTGGIVYHLMAGYGAGRKAVLPGISSYEAIQKNHTLCLADTVGGGCHPDMVSGNITYNRMNDDQLEHAEALNADFLINIVANAEGKLARVVAGHWYDAWKAGTETIDEIYGVPVKGLADCVIASAGGYPKDINLYQGIKTQDNAVKACREGGVVILVMELDDINEPADFVQWFNHPTVYDHEVALRAGFTVPGFASLCLREGCKKFHHIIVTEEKNRPTMAKVGIPMATSIEEALEEAKGLLGRDDFSITYMPLAANTMPIVQEGDALEV